MLERIKTILRISHDKLDIEIENNVSTARAELIRVGVMEQMAESEDILIQNAIISFCLSAMGDEKNSQQYDMSWEYQRDNLRKSRKYNGNGKEDENV